MYILYSGEWSSSEGETEDAREGQGAGGSQPDSMEEGHSGTFQTFLLIFSTEQTKWFYK